LNHIQQIKLFLINGYKKEAKLFRYFLPSIGPTADADLTKTNSISFHMSTGDGLLAITREETASPA